MADFSPRVLSLVAAAVGVPLPLFASLEFFPTQFKTSDLDFLGESDLFRIEATEAAVATEATLDIASDMALELENILLHTSSPNFFRGVLGRK